MHSNLQAPGSVNVCIVPARQQNMMEIQNVVLISEMSLRAHYDEEIGC